MTTAAADCDPTQFVTHFANPRDFQQAYVHEGVGGLPVVLVHGWPETKRIFWRVIKPLASNGCEVIVPDLRGFGDSAIGPGPYGDVPTHARDVYALAHDHLGHQQVTLVGGDLGGPVIQELALRYPEWVTSMVLFNSPLPYLKEAMGGMNSRPPREAADYYLRQGTDADALVLELSTPAQRRRYVETFYGSRFWAHPGSFTAEAAAFHAEPFGDGDKLRASVRAYESSFCADARSEPGVLGRNGITPTTILFGTSDHVLYPEFDLMAATVFARHHGPFLLRNCGHFVPWESPGPLVDAVLMTVALHR